MSHFLKYILVYASIMYQFERFIVVKIAERVQELSRQKCTGCINQHTLDQLHPCNMVEITERIRLFLPKVKSEALSRVENLLQLYQHNAWISDEQEFLDGGTKFIKNLSIANLIDRRYINEDTVFEHPYDSSWVANEADFLVGQVDKVYVEPPMIQSLPPLLPLDPAMPMAIDPIKTKNKKRKSKN